MKLGILCLHAFLQVAFFINATSGNAQTTKNAILRSNNNNTYECINKGILLHHYEFDASVETFSVEDKNRDAVAGKLQLVIIEEAQNIRNRVISRGFEKCVQSAICDDVAITAFENSNPNYNKAAALLKPVYENAVEYNEFIISKLRGEETFHVPLIERRLPKKVQAILNLAEEEEEEYYFPCLLYSFRSPSWFSDELSPMFSLLRVAKVSKTEQERIDALFTCVFAMEYYDMVMEQCVEERKNKFWHENGKTITVLLGVAGFCFMVGVVLAVLYKQRLDRQKQRALDVNGNWNGQLHQPLASSGF